MGIKQINRKSIYKTYRRRVYAEKSPMRVKKFCWAHTISGLRHLPHTLYQHMLHLLFVWSQQRDFIWHQWKHRRKFSRILTLRMSSLKCAIDINIRITNELYLLMILKTNNYHTCYILVHWAIKKVDLNDIKTMFNSNIVLVSDNREKSRSEFMSKNIKCSC